jgi:hypothetical protein
MRDLDRTDMDRHWTDMDRHGQTWTDMDRHGQTWMDRRDERNALVAKVEGIIVLGIFLNA